MEGKAVCHWEDQDKKGQKDGAVWVVVMSDQPAGDQREQVPQNWFFSFLPQEGFCYLSLFWHILKEMRKRKDENSDGKENWKGQIAMRRQPICYLILHDGNRHEDSEAHHTKWWFI